MTHLSVKDSEVGNSTETESMFGMWKGVKRREHWTPSILEKDDEGGSFKGTREPLNRPSIPTPTCLTGFLPGSQLARKGSAPSVAIYTNRGVASSSIINPELLRTEQLVSSFRAIPVGLPPCIRPAHLAHTAPPEVRCPQYLGSALGSSKYTHAPPHPKVDHHED